MLLPFSKPLSDLIDSGVAPSNDVNVFIGMHALKKSEAFAVSYPQRTIALPPWHNPLGYYWPVSECSILVIDTGYAEPDYLNDLAASLYEADATIVRMITPDFELKIYHKE